MRKGKVASQAAHASMAVVLPYLFPPSKPAKKMTQPMLSWLTSGFKKVVVYVNSDDELNDLYNQAVLNKIPASLITDSGATEFRGVPTRTAVAIGPDKASTIDKLTGHLPLL